jgi:urease accessory protein
VFNFNAFVLQAAQLTQRYRFAIGVVVLLGYLLIAGPAQAHHPFDGQTPDTFLTGFLSGLAHPIIGLRHFVFVIAAGLLAALSRQGILIPIVFVIAGLAGTGIYLQNLDLPAPEFFIAASVLLFGVLLTLKNSPNGIVVVGLGAIAGIFHGYAYGEAIVGAQMTPLLAYLVGFSVIQMVISLTAYGLGKRSIERGTDQKLPIRFAGFVISGIGIALLNSIVFNS